MARKAKATASSHFRQSLPLTDDHDERLASMNEISLVLRISFWAKASKVIDKLRQNRQQRIFCHFGLRFRGDKRVCTGWILVALAPDLVFGAAGEAEKCSM